ncbi:MAG: type II secretion system protein GspF [Gammaproteobacteria bacterium]|nr:type II secretion system inner membrane protein GspF [Gammaproteobacteria bacterium]MXX94214.1 type II secretion system protein GspF [Gammaproteobacteria bacterium]MYF52535.1 type II secretion system protein GspF [Gammaproteobacteria bacterium]MYK44373.1 type II secretion system protein GspF [Gammaproteobacteria bacterium]
MPAYEYVALDTEGRTKKGILEGDSLRHVRQLLRDIGLFPVDVELTTTTSSQEGQIKARKSIFGKLRPMDLVLFTRQIATLANAGLPIEQALSAVGQQTTRRKARSIFMSVRSRVIEGHTLTQSMSEYPSTFDELYRSTVGAGEQSGQLGPVLDSLASYLESQYESRRNIQSALYYPIFLFVVAIVVVALLMTYVLPQIMEFYTQSGDELPYLTVMLVRISNFMHQWWLVIFGSLIVGIILIRYALSINAIKMSWHRFKLSLPVIGWFSQSVNAARYANTLAILGTSGVPLVEGMKIASEVVVNRWIRKLLEHAKTQVSEGKSLNKSLEQTRQFPPIFVHMIASGEMSGSLDSMLFKSAEYQQKDLTRLINTMVELFRPLMLLVMAGIVVTIMLAVLQPILKMSNFSI